MCELFDQLGPPPVGCDGRSARECSLFQCLSIIIIPEQFTVKAHPALFGGVAKKN